MPETIDFDGVAALIYTVATGETILLPEDTAEIVAQLRRVWNARGAADIATIETALASQMGATASGPYLKNLDRELRKLDR